MCARNLGYHTPPFCSLISCLVDRSTGTIAVASSFKVVWWAPAQTLLRVNRHVAKLVAREDGD